MIIPSPTSQSDRGLLEDTPQTGRCRPFSADVGSETALFRVFYGLANAASLFLC